MDNTEEEKLKDLIKTKECDFVATDNELYLTKAGETRLSTSQAEKVIEKESKP